jgi:transposase
MVAAYATGASTYREIAEHFGVHLATMGRLVRRRMQQRAKPSLHGACRHGSRRFGMAVE